MGFSHYSTLIIEKNRKLLKNTTGKYFRKKSDIGLSHHKKSHLTKEQRRTAKRRMRNMAIKQLVPILIGALFIAGILYTILNNSLSSYTKYYRVKVESLEDGVTSSDFNSLMNIGSYNIENRDFISAQTDFTLAIKLYPTSKRAHIGLSKALIMNCNDLGIYCKESFNLYHALQNSPNVFKREKVDLKRWYHSSS